MNTTLSNAQSPASSPVACPPWRDTPANQQDMSEHLERHTRKCSICRHPDRDAIEEEFIHWHRVIWIAQQYDIYDHRSIYRHARALGLIKARRENLHSALDNIVEQSDGINASAGDVLRAIRGYSCLSDTGRWTELPLPPRHLIYSSTASRDVAGTGSAREEGPPVPATGPGNANLPIDPSASKQDSSETSSEFAPSFDDDPTDPSSPNYIEQGPDPADVRAREEWMRRRTRAMDLATNHSTLAPATLIGPPVIRIERNSLKTKGGSMV